MEGKLIYGAPVTVVVVIHLFFSTFPKIKSD
jgi:hypothetical protein